MDKVDVAIAGAGIAGCQLARDLARAGHSVTVVERRPREELSHDWWDSVDAGVFDEVDLPKPEPPELLGTCGEANISMPLGTVTVRAPARPDTMHVDRKLFAQRQVKYAEEAGARIMDNTAVQGPIVEDGTVVGMTVRPRDGEDTELRARLTVDATGMAAAMRSTLSEEHGFQQKVEREGTFVTYREIRKNTSSNRDVDLVFGKNDGVTWINRETEGLVDFFTGVINFPGRPSPRDEVLEMIKNTPEAGPDIVRGGYGAPIPVRHCMDSFVAPGFVLCGDSACQCNPIDGSGIASSLRAAHIAAKVIHAALENDKVDVPTLWPYNAEYKRTQGVKFVALDAIQKFMVSEPKINLEVLLRRGVLKVEDFWGKGGVTADSGGLQQLIKILKLIDRPRFIVRLARGMGAAKELAAHYLEYPETYDPNTFETWRAKKRELFARIPPVYER